MQTKLVKVTARENYINPFILSLIILVFNVLLY